MAPSDGLVGRLRKGVSGLTRPKVIELPSASEKPAGDVLLSYIIAPFLPKYRDSAFAGHTNYWECREMVRTFQDLGYRVDVIDWDDADFVPKKDYSVVVDIHSNLERISSMLPKDCVKILHITGAHWKFQNEAERRRLSELETRRGVSLSPRRTVPPSKGIEHADFATILGNEFTMGTFRYAGKPLYPVHVSTAVSYPWPDEKDFETAGKRFVWFGGPGLVLKGLDIVLEAFAAMPDHRLSVCGPVDREEDFREAYRKELFGTPNISVLGWVDPAGPEFRRVCSECVGLVYPSASEGQCTGVTTCMHAGLIPLISYESGVDVAGFGRILGECTVEGVAAAVKELSAMPSESLRGMARSAWEHARATYTRERFSEEYGRAVRDILARARPGSVR